MDIKETAAIQLMSKSLEIQKMVKTGIIDKTLEYSRQVPSGEAAARAADQDFQVSVLTAGALGKGGKVNELV
jgi:hypothetical protein